MKNTAGDDWAEWLTLFQGALENAGYDMESDLPAYDFVSSEDEDFQARIDGAKLRMFQACWTPEEAVESLIDGRWQDERAYTKRV